MLWVDGDPDEGVCCWFVVMSVAVEVRAAWNIALEFAFEFGFGLKEVVLLLI